MSFRLLCRPARPLTLEQLEDRLVPSTVFTVTNVNDSGAGSLRQAILNANAHLGLDHVVFHIPGPGVHHIHLASTLPALTDSVVLDGTTQPGFSAGHPLIELDGSGAGAGVSGLTLTAGGSTVRGLVINRFAGAGVRLLGAGGDVLTGDFIGTDPSGTHAAGNKGGGIVIASAGNTVGGTSAGSRNLISANGGAGIYLAGPGAGHNVIAGDYIGTDVTGTVKLGNHDEGVDVYNAAGNTIGGTAAGAGDVISGNYHGIRISGILATGNRIQGDFIGTDATGMSILGTPGVGVAIASSGNVVGGTTPAARNVISGNDQGGVRLSGVHATGNLVQGDFLGTNAVGGTLFTSGPYHAVNDVGVVVADAAGNTIGGTMAWAGDLIAGNGGDGVAITGAGATGNLVAGDLIGFGGGNGGWGVEVRGGASANTIGGATAGARNFIYGNLAGGVALLTGAHANVVAGDVIDGAGSTSAPDVLIRDAAGNTIGGTLPEARNVIGNATTDGIQIFGSLATGNVVAGDFIGTDATGTRPAPNLSTGVHIDLGASGNTIGGTAPGARNVIAGNTWGVEIEGTGTTKNLVAGNYIGPDVTGVSHGPLTVTTPFNYFGLVIGPEASGNTIGGTTAGARNVISGNFDDGILLAGSGNLVQGNFIGTNAAGTAAFGNGLNPGYGSGIEIDGSNNTIGGTAPGARNVISGNNHDGIQINGIRATGNAIQGDFIGTRADGVTPLGNKGAGVSITNGASHNTIGGTTAGTGNVIAFNNGGVVVAPPAAPLLNATGDAILRNSIFGNKGLGIDLGADGATANDTGDSDTGANGLQNYPVLTSAQRSSAGTVLKGTLNSTANHTFRLEFFANPSADPSGHGQGRTFLGAVTVTTGGTGVASFTAAVAALPPGPAFVTATATDVLSNDTSEFSHWLQVPGS